MATFFAVGSRADLGPLVLRVALLAPRVVYATAEIKSRSQLRYGVCRGTVGAACVLSR